MNIPKINKMEAHQKDKLSEPMKRTLNKLKESDCWQTAYDLSESLKTLKALYHRDLISAKYGRGYLFFPRTSIRFKFINHG